MKNTFLRRAILCALLTAVCALLCACFVIHNDNPGKRPSTEQNTQASEKTHETSDETPACLHVYGAWKTVREQSCTESGERQRVCSKCGYTDSIVQPPKGHTVVIDEGVSPTCTEPGTSNGSRCSVCGKIIEAQKPLPAWGHNYITVAGRPATCENDGLTDGKRCSICGKVESEQHTVPAFGHKPVESPDTEPRCEDPGTIGGTHCSVCGKILIEPQYIPALGHDIVTDPPVASTCAEPGRTEGSHCMRCGKVINEPQLIAALPHTPVNDDALEPTCEQDGRRAGSHCAVCGKILSGCETVPALGHRYNEDGFCILCGAEKPKNLPITGIVLDRDVVRLEVGESVKLTATLLPDGAIKNRIEWINEGKEYYSITQDGVLTALKPGKTTMTVYVEDRSTGERKSFTKTCKVEITKDGGFGDLVPVTGISVKRDNYTLSVGETVKIEYTILPENATDKRVIIINEPGEDGTKTYLQVDSAAGTVTALKPGKAQVTLYTQDSGKTKSIWFVIVDDG